MRYSLLILLVIIFLVRLSLYSNNFKDGEKVNIKAKVLVEPIAYDSKSRIQISGLFAYIDKYPEVKYGDEIEVNGIVNGNRLDNVHLVKIKKRGTNIYSVRNKIITLFQSTLPEPHSSIVSGIVLGSKESMPESFWESLKRSGTAHVVVASGMNVTFVAGFVINSLAGFINRRKAIIIALITIWIYVALSGFDAPLIRAAIMGTIAFSATALGRISIALNALTISALLMLILNPLWINDIGFVLSFVATLSLILFERFVNSKLYFVPKIFRGDLSTSIAAQIGVAPILLIIFGQFNLLSPFINTLILWTIPPIMIIGMISGLVGLLTEPLGRLILYFVYPLTWWFSYIVDLTGK